VTLGIVKNSPSTSGLNQLLPPNRFDRRFQVGNLKEQNSFVLRWVGLSPLSLKANKTCATVEFRVAPNLLITHSKTERLVIELLSSLQIVKVEFNTDESCVDRLHKNISRAQYKCLNGASRRSLKGQEKHSGTSRNQPRFYWVSLILLRTARDAGYDNGSPRIFVPRFRFAGLSTDRATFHLSQACARLPVSLQTLDPALSDSHNRASANAITFRFNTHRCQQRIPALPN